MGQDVFQAGVRWLSQSSFPLALHETHIILILKYKRSSTLKELRPISLCSVVYNVILKVLTNRLKSELSGIISNNQSAFVNDRSIMDNVFIGFKILHDQEGSWW